MSPPIPPSLPPSSLPSFLHLTMIAFPKDHALSQGGDTEKVWCGFWQKQLMVLTKLSKRWHSKCLYSKWKRRKGLSWSKCCDGWRKTRTCPARWVREVSLWWDLTGRVEPSHLKEEGGRGLLLRTLIQVTGAAWAKERKAENHELVVRSLQSRLSTARMQERSGLSGSTLRAPLREDLVMQVLGAAAGSEQRNETIWAGGFNLWGLEEEPMCV